MIRFYATNGEVGAADRRRTKNKNSTQPFYGIAANNVIASRGAAL